MPSWGHWKGKGPIIPREHTYYMNGQALGLDVLRVLVDDKANRNFISWGLASDHLRSQHTAEHSYRGVEMRIGLQLGPLFQVLNFTTREFVGVDIILGLPWIREHQPKYVWDSPGVGKVHIHRGLIGCFSKVLLLTKLNCPKNAKNSQKYPV